MNNNWGIIGHQHIISFLQKSIVQDKLAHTYLFYGLPSVGKTVVAEKFAGMLLGQSQNQTTELYKLEVLEGKKDISIGQVREWRRSLSLKSFTDQYKVGIIYEADKLNRASANAILKTIEEPTAKTVIIIITSDWQKLLPTIISRSQTIKFLPTPLKELAVALAKKVADKKKLRQLISLSQGRTGLAVRLASDKEFFNNHLRYQDLIAKIFKASLPERWQILDKIIEPLKDLRQKTSEALNFLNHLETQLRNFLLICYQLDYLASSQTSPSPIQISSSSVVKLLSLIRKSKDSLNMNVQPRLVLENVLLNI